MRIGRLVSILILGMGITVFIGGIMGGRVPLRFGTFKRRLMKYQGREIMDSSRLYRQGVKSLEKKKGMLDLKPWRMEKRSSWRK